MPSLGFGEILIILVFALIVFGPRRLPEMGRTIGRSLRELRRATSDLRAEVESDLDEPPATTVAERQRQVAERTASPDDPLEGGTPPA